MKLYIVIAIVLLIPFLIKEQRLQIKERKEEQRILALAEKDAMLLRDFKRNLVHLQTQKLNQPGVYIFSNLSKNNYKYVGQSIDMINRVKTHIRGNGNPEMYKDIINGDIFTINLIKLKDTKFSSLNSLERYYISKYNTYYNGYNKTRGNI